jgi:DNA primase
LWLLKKTSGGIIPFFKNRIIFPIYDHMGNLVAFSWRAIKDWQEPKYLNTPDTPLYDKSKILYWLNIAKNYIKNHSKIFVVEWYMDVIALARWWIPIWCWTCWTALTTNHLKLLKRLGATIVFAFDNDDAWQKATIRWIKLAFEQDLFPKIFILPNDYKDFDEAVNKLWEEDFKKLILDEKNYLDSYQWLIRVYSKKYNLEDIIQRKQFIQDYFDVISNLNDYSSIEFFIEKLGEFLQIETLQLLNQFKTFLRKNKQKINTTKSQTEQPDKYLLLSALIFNSFYETLLEKNGDIEKFEKIIELISWIIPYLWENILSKTIDESLSEEEKIKIKETQLRWEKQKDDGISTTIFKLAISFLQDLLKQLKTSNIPPEERLLFINEFNKLIKKSWKN